jgi:hypothetical protein
MVNLLPGKLKSDDNYGYGLVGLAKFIRVEGNDLYVHSDLFGRMSIQIIADWYNTVDEWHKVPPRVEAELVKQFWWFGNVIRYVRKD